MSTFRTVDWRLPLEREGDRVPKLTPFLERLVDEVEANVQAPRGLVLMSMLSAMSIAAQSQFDMSLPAGPTVPTSLMLLAIAASGERKTAIENIFLKPIRDFQSRKEIVFSREIKAWEAKNIIWSERRNCILKKIRKSPDSGELASECLALMMELEEARPIKPKRPRLLYEDTTPEALFAGVAGDIPAVGLISSEGGGILNGYGFNDLEKYNSAWSGSPIAVDRRSSESFKIDWVRLTVAIQVQESAFCKYMERAGEESRGVGIWARFLIFEPMSKQGFRVATGIEKSWHVVEEFGARVQGLLEGFDSSSMACFEVRKTLRYESKAAEKWLYYANLTEREMRPGWRYEGATDHASKLAENIARVSALLHVFEGRSGDISEDILNVAIDICFYCSSAFMRRFMPPLRERMDAEMALVWLGSIKSSGCRYIKLNHIRKYGPNKLRESARLKSAIEVLVDSGLVSMIKIQKVVYVDLSPGGQPGYVVGALWCPGGLRDPSFPSRQSLAMQGSGGI